MGVGSHKTLKIHACRLRNDLSIALADHYGIWPAFRSFHLTDAACASQRMANGGPGRSMSNAENLLHDRLTVEGRDYSRLVGKPYLIALCQSCPSNAQNRWQASLGLPKSPQSV